MEAPLELEGVKLLGRLSVHRNLPRQEVVLPIGILIYPYFRTATSGPHGRVYFSA